MISMENMTPQCGKFRLPADGHRVITWLQLERLLQQPLRQLLPWLLHLPPSSAQQPASCAPCPSLSASPSSPPAPRISLAHENLLQPWMMKFCRIGPQARSTGHLNLEPGDLHGSERMTRLFPLCISLIIVQRGDCKNSRSLADFDVLVLWIDVNGCMYNAFDGSC